VFRSHGFGNAFPPTLFDLDAWQFDDSEQILLIFSFFVLRLVFPSADGVRFAFPPLITLPFL